MHFSPNGVSFYTSARHSYPELDKKIPFTEQFFPKAERFEEFGEQNGRGTKLARTLKYQKCYKTHTHFIKMHKKICLFFEIFGELFFHFHEQILV